MQIKNKKQIKLLRKSAKITLEIFNKISKEIKSGVRESDIAKIIKTAIREKGVKRSFGPIVASGPNAANPHAKVTNRRFKVNDIVIIDFGVVFKRYHSDMTRTLILGKGSTRMRSLYKTVKTAQQKAIKKARNGIKISSFVKNIHDYMRNKGFGRYILHSLGHGVGLKVHEAPKLSEKNRKILKKGMVCTIEPGLYIKGLGGVRIEDMILIKNGRCQILTK